MPGSKIMVNGLFGQLVLKRKYPQEWDICAWIRIWVIFLNDLSSSLHSSSGLYWKVLYISDRSGTATFSNMEYFILSGLPSVLGLVTNFPSKLDFWLNYFFTEVVTENVHLVSKTKTLKIKSFMGFGWKFEEKAKFTASGGKGGIPFSEHL